MVGAEHLGGITVLAQVGENRVPGDHGVTFATAPDLGQILVRDVLDDHIAFLQVCPFQGAAEQVMGYRVFHQQDGLALEVLDVAVAATDQDAVGAGGEVTDDQGSGVDAGSSRDGQGVHVGHGAGGVVARSVLLDGGDVVRHLLDFNLDIVLFCPLVDDALLGHLPPEHPAGVDRPADLELGCFRAGAKWLQK